LNPQPALPGYTPREEIANSVTHGIGIVLAGAALHYFAVLFYVIPWPGPVATA